MARVTWDTDTIEFMRACLEQNWTAKELAAELGCSEDTIKKKKVELGLSGIVKRGARNDWGVKKYTDEELLDILRTSDNKTYAYFTRGGKGLPAAATYVNRFGSWGKALELAGLPPNKCSMLEDRRTKLYLLDFGDFYKVGITQQNIKDRFGGGYPNYTTIMVLEYDNLADAKAKEEEWLSNVSQYAYVPENFPKEGRGFTECFKY